MSEFVEECRREWKRLGVPDPVANEMAADLAADLNEAEADGASAEDVLGNSAFDARSFAAAWATERGLTRPPHVNAYSPPRRRHTRTAAIVAFAAITIIGAVLLIAAHQSGPPRVAIAAPFTQPRYVPQLPQAVGPRFERVPAWVAVGDNGNVKRTAGSVLTIIGLTGLFFATILWLWPRPGRGVPRAFIDAGPTGPV